MSGLRLSSLAVVASLTAGRPAVAQQCPPIVVFAEDFDAGVLPAGWTTRCYTEITCGTDHWKFTDECGAACMTGKWAVYDPHPDLGCLLVFAEGAYLRSPWIDLPAVAPNETLLLELCLRADPVLLQGPQDRLIIESATDPSSNMQWNWIAGDGPVSWDLTPWAGHTIVMNWGCAGSDFRTPRQSMALDNIRVHLYPAEPGDAVCLGDGSGSPCPCANDSPNAGEGCVHSGGVGMRISACGSSSIAANDLSITASQIPVGNTGLFFVGSQLLSPPLALFDGFQCAGGSSARYGGLHQTDGVATLTGVSTPYPFFTAGTTYYFQYFTRDNQAGPTPCNGFANLSPAYAVTMSP